jgi:hypothetical protein
VNYAGSVEICVSAQNRFDEQAYKITSAMLGSDEPLIAMRGMTIRALRKFQRRKETPEIFHDPQKIAWFLAKKFPHAILPHCKLRANCQCGPCTFPWHKPKPARRISIADCEFDPPCRACKDTKKAIVWCAVIYRWFLMGHSNSQVDTSHHWKSGTTDHIVQKIRRQLCGERQDGLPRTGNPRGRPKRKPQPKPSDGVFLKS